ncbi:MAG: 50S ribosomal protein L29 [Candidatus Omnitrophica bacterium]|nr:50S ribosomal protein L29 [Candidatus Omnitrophota bacterium]
MKLKEMKNMDSSELALREKFLKKELFDLRLQSRLGQVEKPSRFQNMKKEIARVLTILNERKTTDGKQK